MAGLALWELMHGDAGAEIYSAATVSKQARVVYGIAQLIARNKIERGDWGVIEDERVGGLLYGLDKGDDYRDQSVWIKANPNLNVSVIVESLLAKVKQSDEAVDQRADIRIKHFNEWIDGNTTWIDSDTWKACAIDWATESMQEAPLFVGVDLAQTTDLCAITYLWQLEKMYYVDFECWSTEAYIASLSDSIRPVFKRAVEDGKLHVCPGRIVDYDELVLRLASISQDRWVMNVGIDPYNAGIFKRELERRRLPVTMVNQSVRALNATTKRVRDLVIGKRLYHRGVEFLNWQVSNAKLYRDVNENHKVVKDENTPHRKIDAVIALLCAMKVAEDHVIVERRSDVRYVPL